MSLSLKKVDTPLVFSQELCLSFVFFTMPPNDRGYGLGRSAGEFPVAIATKEMRAQRLPEAHWPPKAHRRVLCGRSFVSFSVVLMSAD